MVTLSVSATAEAVKKIADRHDADVICWVNDILNNTEVIYSICVLRPSCKAGTLQAINYTYCYAYPRCTDVCVIIKP